MLNIQGITKMLGGQQILKNITFNAENGKLTVLEGQNGAGKSTLFNIIAGYFLPDGGTIRLNDMELAHVPAIARATSIAILQQDPKTETILAFSVLENFAVALLKGRRARFREATKNIRSIVTQKLEEFGMNTDLDKPMGALSGGQRQMLAFAMATMEKPALLLLDEPTAALDDRSSHLLIQSIVRYVKDWQVPCVMISHDHELNRRYADVIIRLEAGEIKR